MHLKKSARESVPEVMMSSEARSPEALVHQKMRDFDFQRLFNGFNLL